MELTLNGKSRVTVNGKCLYSIGSWNESSVIPKNRMDVCLAFAVVSGRISSDFWFTLDYTHVTTFLLFAFSRRNLYSFTQEDNNSSACNNLNEPLQITLFISFYLFILSYLFERENYLAPRLLSEPSMFSYNVSSLTEAFFYNHLK